ncbi:MAG TPA: glycosyltransferase family 4 protein [Candidatus Saccharimonadia bacterium]|nr:glycosyltransferase family 4 protein [Candidatus Saccharimonadia bacterium]
MKLLWLAWKDIKHPEAGGAELVARELCRRLVDEGHEVTLLTCGYDGAGTTQFEDGIQIVRVGSNRYLHPFQALTYYLRHLRGNFDVLIEEVNGGAPYFSVLFERKARRFLLYHQLARLNWLYEIRQPFGYLGYYGLVPVATRLASFAHAPVITVSESTRHVLAGYGFRPDRTHVISEGLTIRPIENLADVKKFTHPTLLSLGAMRAMKRTVDHIAAFEFAKQQIPDLQLKIAGKTSGAYGEKVLAYMRNSKYSADIEYLGVVSNANRALLMQRAHLIMQTAVEEGWGLTITEAASQGTPAVAYDVAGLRDSVRNNVTGILTKENPEALGQAMAHLLQMPALYDRFRKAAWKWSHSITFDQSYKDFKAALGVI